MHNAWPELVEPTPAVVQAPDERRVVDVLTDSHALRRYSEGPEPRRQALIGDEQLTRVAIRADVAGAIVMAR